MIKRVGSSNSSTKNFWVTVMTFAFFFVTLLYITEIRLRASKTSLWHLHEPLQSLQQQICKDTKTGRSSVRGCS